MAVTILDDDSTDLSSEQADLLQSGLTIIRECPWPCDPSVRVGMHVLSRASTVEAIAQARLDEKLYRGEVAGEKTPAPDPMIVEKLYRDEVVVRAFVGPARRAGAQSPPFNPDQPLFNGTEDLRTKFAEAEIELLYQMYATWEQQVSPLMRAEFKGDQQTFDAILAEIKKKAPEEPSVISVLPRATLEALLIYSVCGRAET